MGKRTKTQKRALVTSLVKKSRELYMEGLLSSKDVEAINRIMARCANKPELK